MKRKYGSRPRRIAVFLKTAWGKAALFVFVLAVIAGLAALTALVIVPAFQGGTDGVSSTLAKKRFRDSATVVAHQEEENSLAELVSEASITVSTISDPQIYGSEILFTTTSVIKGLIVYNNLMIYDTETGGTVQQDGISLKYDNILFPVMNDDYIAFLDSDTDGGGRVCVYNRATHVQTAIKDYLYGAPVLQLCGNRLAFMQQAGTELDRLYIVDLETHESVAYRVFSGLPTAPAAVNASGSKLVYAVPYASDDGHTRSRIYSLDLTTGEETDYDPGRAVSYVKTDGRHIAYQSSVSGAATSLYLLDGTASVLIADEVLNFEIQNGYIAYTRNQEVYAYSLDKKQHYRLNSDISRALLASANGSTVCFFDITGGYDDPVNILKYLKVSF